MEHNDAIEKQIERKIENKLKKIIPKVFKIFFMILVGILFAFLVGYVVMSLWNWLMPDLFGLTTISYWQAVGILILAKLLFGFGYHGSHKDKGKHQKRSHSRKCGSLRRDFSKWELYDKFWKEEGENAYMEYMARTKEKE
ncbi:MAG: hypothetical protein QM485_06480 [Flavobacteriaceae bacterium]